MFEFTFANSRLGSSWRFWSRALGGWGLEKGGTSAGYNARESSLQGFHFSPGELFSVVWRSGVIPGDLQGPPQAFLFL